MSNRPSVRILTLTVATVAACLVSAGSASAQAYLSGRFSLPYEVHWRGAILPAGDYTITMTRFEEPALLRHAGGASVGLVSAVSVRNARDDAPTGLFVALIGTNREVRSFNWRERGLAFVYSPMTDAERTSLTENKPPESVPVRLAAR